MTPAYAALLPKIQSNNAAAALRAAAGAHNWRLRFLEFPPTLLGYGDIVRIGDGSTAQTSLSQVPYDIEIDRVYVHGDPLYGQKRGIALNGRKITIRNSYVSDIKAVGSDTQAIGGWNGPGPFTIENNYLEAAGENFILGGSDPRSRISSAKTSSSATTTCRSRWRGGIRHPGARLRRAVACRTGVLPAGVYAYQVVALRPVGGGTIGRPPPSVGGRLSDGAGRMPSWSRGRPCRAQRDYRVYGRAPGSASLFWTVTGTSFIDTGAAGAPGRRRRTPPAGRSRTSSS